MYLGGWKIYPGQTMIPIKMTVDGARCYDTVFFSESHLHTPVGANPYLCAVEREINTSSKAVKPYPR